MTYDHWKTTNPEDETLGPKPVSGLDIWTIYRHPRDYPDKYVARKTVVPPGTPTNDMFIAGSLDEARALLPRGLHRMPRSAEDDPVIVEVWL